MAQFVITSPEIKTVPVGKQNAGTKYLIAQLQNKQCPWEEPTTLTSFIPHIVAAFEQVLPIAKGGVAQTEQAIPAELQVINGCFVNYTPEQKFYKQHLSAHPAKPATPTSPARAAINIGDLVSKNGIPIVYKSMPVFCPYYFDENNEKQWWKGNSPEEVGSRNFQSFCVPVQEERIASNPATAGFGPQSENVGGQTVATVDNPSSEAHGAVPTFQQTPAGGGIPTM